MQVLATTMTEDGFARVASCSCQKFVSSTHFRDRTGQRRRAHVIQCLAPLLKTSCFPFAQNSFILSKPPVLPIVLSSPPPDRNTRSRTRLQSSARYASSQNNHMSMLLHFSPSTSACFQCQQRSIANASSCAIPRSQHRVHPLSRCKMGSPHKNTRKSFPVTLANADILLDQPAPDHSTKAILSITSMGDATVNGDMPSSSFLSVSPLSSSLTGLHQAN